MKCCTQASHNSRNIIPTRRKYVDYISALGAPRRHPRRGPSTQARLIHSTTASKWQQPTPLRRLVPRERKGALRNQTDAVSQRKLHQQPPLPHSIMQIKSISVHGSGDANARAACRHAPTAGRRCAHARARNRVYLVCPGWVSISYFSVALLVL